MLFVEVERLLAIAGKIREMRNDENFAVKRQWTDINIDKRNVQKKEGKIKPIQLYFRWISEYEWNMA